jgi:hypothetical protein
MYLKYLSILIVLGSISLYSCKKEKINLVDTYGEKIVGIWTCDSIVEFKPDFNDSLIYENTDIVPKTYIFKKAAGANMYEWDDKLVTMDENDGSMYREGPLGDLGDTWYITYIDLNKCILKLDFRGGLGSYVTNQYWYYLRR